MFAITLIDFYILIILIISGTFRLKLEPNYQKIDFQKIMIRMRSVVENVEKEYI